MKERHHHRDKQGQLYRDQLMLFAKVPNLAGICPWILADFRPPVRLQPQYQKGRKRKGLLSERVNRKNALYEWRNDYSCLKNP